MWVSTLVLLVCIIIDKFLLPTLFLVVYNFFIDFCKRKNGQKQVKNKAFKINAKIEDVGLNEVKKVWKQEMVTKFS